jgi:hypothetical protein
VTSNSSENIKTRNKQKNKLRISKKQKLPTSVIDNLKEEPCISFEEVEIHNSKPGLYPLLVTNIDHRVKHKMLFNIFSLYGNIDKIYVDANKLEAIVYYETEFNQLMGMHHLQDICLFEKNIQIFKLKRTKGKRKNSRQSVTSQMSHELPSSKQKTINKPNKILYIFNLSKNLTLDIVKGNDNPILTV